MHVCISVGGWVRGVRGSVRGISVGNCWGLSMESLCGCGYGSVCTKGLGRGV